MRPTRSLHLLVAPVLALSACGPDDPSPEVDVPSAPLEGTFAVSSRFEVPATVAAPGPLGDALRLVHSLATDPGTALLDLAEDAGVPAVGELRMVLPDSLEAKLAGWMNAHLEAATAGGVSPHARIVELDGLVRSVLLRWELRSELRIAEGAGGRHEPLALAFDSPAGPIVVPVDATAPVTAGVDVTGTVTWPGGPRGEAVATVGGHAMGIPFGRYALDGLDRLLLSELGVPDVAGALAAAVDCDALAASVAARCAGPLCVGHREALVEICLGGLAEAAARIEDRVTALDFEAIHFERGTAAAIGASLDPPAGATALRDGVWTASIDLGNGAEAATATFTAVR